MRDSNCVWCQGEIVEVISKHENSAFDDMVVRIHYCGWGGSKDEYISTKSNRLSKKGVFTSRSGTLLPDLIDILKYAEVLEGQDLDTPRRILRPTMRNSRREGVNLPQIEDELDAEIDPFAMPFTINLLSRLLESSPRLNLGSNHIMNLIEMNNSDTEAANTNPPRQSQ